MDSPRTRDRIDVGVLVYDGAQALDITGPLDVFAAANQLAGRKPAIYRLHVIGLTPDPVRTECGLRLLPELTLDQAPPLDTLILPGGAGSRHVNTDAALLDWIRDRAASSRRTVSVCTGIYLLAATGLLDGRRVTTHWQYAADVQRRYPALRMDADQLFLRDGAFHTSGGLTAGLDLALALVEDDLDQAIALAVARELVMYMKRPGNQAQFSAPLDAQTRGGGRLAALVEWVLEHLHENLGAERLADRMAMSTRNFRRVFTEQFDCPPAVFIARLRLERACDLLTASTLGVDRIATDTGFASADALRRAFRARYLSSPLEYRERFSR